MNSAFKMTPDPSNIWSFHETYTPTRSGTHSVPVVVDFDGDGKMDTNYKNVRVLITDIQVWRFRGPLREVVLMDDKGQRWALPNLHDTNISDFLVDHLRTPLALPVDSGLRIQFVADQNFEPVDINLIGRLITL